MRRFASSRKKALVLLSLGTAATALMMCTNVEKDSGQPPTGKIRFAAFAGSASCMHCHRDVYEKHLQTEHHLTSSAAAKGAIMGSFESDSNAFAFDALNKVVMEKRDSGFYQVYYRNGERMKAAKVDVVVGSGRKGQSYLNWTEAHLSQLPITYFTPAKQWSNSPGYPPSKVVFNRPITSRCLECHSTYFESLPSLASSRERFDRNKIILGVECEKCHGPAAQHVAFQTDNPQSREAKFIVNPAKLSRERVMDFCSLCHGGPLSKTRPSFSFGAGDTLENYFSVPDLPQAGSAIDVHGNQTGLLRMSKCFQLSGLTCLNCHNVHQAEKDRVQVFSQRCAACHNEGHGKVCKMTATLGRVLQQNCIDCHMPKQPSRAVAVYLQGASSPSPALMRTHYITAYPGETKNYIEALKQKGIRFPERKK